MPHLSAPLIGLIVALVVLIALALAVWLASGRLLARRPPDPPRTPAEVGVPFDRVIFPARDGVRLHGRLTKTISPDRDARAVIVFCPGLFGSMDGDTDLVPMFTESGYDVFQFDWRAHGQSEGRRCTLGLAEPLDVLGALDFLELRGIRRVGLMALSFGGAVALRAVALDHRPLAVVCDGVFVRLSHAVSGLLAERFGGLRAALLRPLVSLALALAAIRLHDSLSRAEPMDAVTQVSPRPVLFIHGALDPIVPVADQEALFTACGDPKSMWLVGGAGHREARSQHPEEYRRHVIEFFDTYMRGELATRFSDPRRPH